MFRLQFFVKTNDGEYDLISGDFETINDVKNYLSFRNEMEKSGIQTIPELCEKRFVKYCKQDEKMIYSIGFSKYINDCLNDDGNPLVVSDLNDYKKIKDLGIKFICRMFNLNENNSKMNKIFGEPLIYEV